VCKINDSLLVVNYNKTNNSYTHWDKPFNISQNYLECEISTINPDRIFIGGTSWPYYLKFSENLDTIRYFGYGYGFHNDLRSCIYTDDGNGNEIAYFGTDGGITKEINPDTTDKWYYIANDGTNGIRNIDVQGFDVSRYGEDLLVIGTSHDCNIRKKDNAFLRVFGLGGGDVQSVLIDPEDPNKFFGVQYGHPEIEYTISMGEPSGTLFSNYLHTAVNPPILFYKPNQNRILYAGFNDTIWEFDTDNIPPTPITNPVSYSWPNDGNGYQYIKEVGVSNDLENMFFASTNRYWMGWDGWFCNPVYPHINVIFKVTIIGDDLIFTDLTDDPNLDKGLCGGPITGIAVEVNENDTILYVSFGGTADSPEAQKNKKVYYSKDLGETWFAMAEGLDPQIPVNDIQYHKESGMLFLASDVGVYYYDRIDSLWRNITDNLPPMSYNRIRFSFLKNKILVGSQAKGIWEADLPCFYNSSPVTISTDKTWNHSVALHSDLIIEAGATLTINKDVYVPQGSKIIVKRTGRLIVDGGKITSACGGLWKGIEVWGDPTKSSDVNNQGLVWIKNGGTIENAECGIRAVKADREK
jgi:hypothetical protein